MTLSRNFVCLIDDVFGFNLTRVTTSDMRVEVDVARMFPFGGLCDIDAVEPRGVLRGDSNSSLLFASWYL